MASLDFTDTTGAASLASGWPGAAGNRFQNWTPGARPIGEGANALGDGRRYLFQFRLDYTVSLEIPGIPNSGLDIALRCMAHLLGGGSVTITTDDATSNAYTDCTLAPGTEPELVFDDRQTLEYRFKCTLLDVSGTPAPLLCVY